jgi:hypothetical protein
MFGQQVLQFLGILLQQFFPVSDDQDTSADLSGFGDEHSDEPRLAGAGRSDDERMTGLPAEE